MDAAESVEDAVRREVEEETGVVVDQVRLDSSQPWPFPRSLMLGCYASASNTKIKVNTEEIEDARWFHVEDVRKALAKQNPALLLPPSFAISHHLIKTWANSV